MTPDERVIQFLENADNEGFDRAAILEAMAKILWEIAGQGEDLPLAAFLASRLRDPDQAEIEWAKRRAGELGLP